MRSGSDAKSISPSPAQLLLTFAKLLFEKVITTMDTLTKVPRSAVLKKLLRRAEQAARGHLNSEEMAAYVGGNVSHGAGKLKVPRSAPLKNLALRAEQAEGDHLSTEEMAAYVSGNVSRGARKRIVFHLDRCEDCRTTVAEIEKSKTFVKDVDEPSR